MDLNVQNIERVYVRGNSINIVTPSCGCCSAYYSNNTDACFTAWSLPVDELVKYIEQEEERLEALKDYVIACESEIIDFVPED